MLPARYPARTKAKVVRSTDPVAAHPVVNRIPVEVVEERVDVRAPVGLVIDEVSVLVDVERDQWGRVPDRVGVLRVADVVEEPAFVPIVGGPGPPAPGHPGRLQVGPPRVRGAEVPRDQLPDRSVRIAAPAPEAPEIE